MSSKKKKKTKFIFQPLKFRINFIASSVISTCLGIVGSFRTTRYRVYRVSIFFFFLFFFTNCFIDFTSVIFAFKRFSRNIRAAYNRLLWSDHTIFITLLIIRDAIRSILIVILFIFFFQGPTRLNLLWRSYGLTTSCATTAWNTEPISTLACARPISVWWFVGVNRSTSFWSLTKISIKKPIRYRSFSPSIAANVQVGNVHFS